MSGWPMLRRQPERRKGKVRLPITDLGNDVLKKRPEFLPSFHLIGRGRLSKTQRHGDFIQSCLAFCFLQRNGSRFSGPLGARQRPGSDDGRSERPGTLEILAALSSLFSVLE